MPSFGPVELLIIPLVLVVGVLGTIFWILMLVDCLSDKTMPQERRIGWAVAIALSHLIGATLYYFLQKKDRSLRPARG